MEIADITAIPIEIPLIPLEEPLGLAPYVTGTSGVTNAANRTLVRLETRDGVVGWGEVSTMVRPQVMKTMIEEEVAPTVIGEPVWAIKAFLEHFQPTLYLELDAFASGIEMAMWDALGQVYGAPVHQLLGGKTTNEVEFAYALGILSPDAAAARMREVQDAGFSVVKTKVGGYDVDTDPPELGIDRSIAGDVERLIAMTEAVDGEVELRADANQSWTPEDTVRAGQQLEAAGVSLEYFEQPVRVDSIGTYTRLRQRLTTPIAVNEDMYFSRNFLELIAHDAIDAGVIDMVPAGGILPMRRLAGIAEEAGISLAHHCGFDLGIKTAAMTHAIAATPAINLASDTVYYALEDDVITEPFEFEHGTLPVSDDPGFGIEVDESKVDEYAVL